MIFDFDNNTEATLNDDYQEILLSNLSTDLMKENIKMQIDKPLSLGKDRINYLEILNKKYEILKTTYAEEESMLRKVEGLYEKFNREVLEYIIKRYDLSFVNEDLLIQSSFYTKLLYNFFVLYYEDNLIEFFIQTILNNKKNIIANFDDSIKNIETISLKKIFKNKGDAVIMANLLDIVTGITNSETDYQNILQAIFEADINNLTNYALNQLFFQNTVILGGHNFYKMFFAPIILKQEGYTIIYNEVKNQLFNSFQKK